MEIGYLETYNIRTWRRTLRIQVCAA